MEHQFNDERLIRSYLLGDLSEEDREQVERQMMVDWAYSSFVSALEEELIEDYVSGIIEPEDIRKFERVFLTTPSGIERVKLTRNLQAYARKHASENLQATAQPAGAAPEPISLADYLRTRGLAARIALATAAGLVILVGAALVFRILQLQERLDSAGLQPADSRVQQLEEQLAEQQARNQEMARSLQDERDRRLKQEQEAAAPKDTGPVQPSPALPAIVLSPGRPRGGGQLNELVIRPNASQVSFRLLIRKTSFTLFQASVQTEDGRAVWSGPAQLSPSGTEVRLTVPAERLSNARYLIQLRGVAGQGVAEEMPIYYFTVVKR